MDAQNSTEKYPFVKRSLSVSLFFFVASFTVESHLSPQVCYFSFLGAGLNAGPFFCKHQSTTEQLHQKFLQHC